MEPRLKTSQKWTNFPADFCDQVKGVFSENFKDLAANGEFVVEGRIYSEEVMLRIGYLESGRIKQLNFESSINYDPKKVDALQRIHLCVDASASMVQSYVDNKSTDFPLDWKEFEFEKKKIFLRFSSVNSKLEDDADKLLGESGEELVKGSDDSEE